MKRYLIEEAKCGITDGGMASSVVASLKINDGAVTRWLTLVEVDGIVCLYMTDRDIYEEALQDDYSDEFQAYLDSHAIDNVNGLEFSEDYTSAFSSIYDDPENPAVPVVRYLIALVRCEMEETEGLIRMAAGKYADELDIPVSDVEEEYMEDAEDEDQDESVEGEDDEDEDGEDDEDEDDDYEDEDSDYDESIPEGIDKVSLYRLRLALEGEILTPNVYQDLDDGAFESLKRKLRNAAARCEDEKEYEAWKNEYVAAEYEKLKGRKFITIPYLFAGIGQYEATMPVEQKASFFCWINGNGSAFAGTERDATEEEIKNYIALHINDKQP